MTDTTKIVRTTTWSAGPGCHGGCGVLAHIKDGGTTAIALDAVGVNNHRQIGQLVVGRSHGGLPDRAFVALAVADHDIGRVVVVSLASRNCHSDADRQAVTEAAAGDFDSFVL